MTAPTKDAPPRRGTDRPLRVLHVGPLPPPLGGIEMAIAAMLGCSELDGVAQEVFNTSRGEAMNVVGRKGPTLERVRRRVALAWALRRRVEADRPEIVHFHCGSDGAFDQGGFLMLLWTTRRYGARLALHFHTDFSVAALPGRTALRRLLFRRLCAPASAVFVPTEQHREALEALDMPQRIVVVPNMCDESLLTVRAPRSHGRRDFTVIFIGRLTEKKGFFDLLEVAARLHERGVPVRFEVAGLPSTNGDARRIADRIRELDLAGVVRLLGAVSGAEKRSLFERADLLVLPSHTESFGLAVLEAMAAGLPVVASRCTGLGSIVVQGETGLLAEPRDVGAFVQAIASLAADPDRAERMGMAGRGRYLEYYSVASVGRLLADEYALLGRGAARPHDHAPALTAEFA